MYSPLGLNVRQVLPLSIALTLALLAPAGAIAQDGAEAAVSPFRPADVPRGTVGQSINDLVAGGPGFVAVGGGSRTGANPRAIVLVSDDGRRWQSVPLFAEAAAGDIVAVAVTPAGIIAVGTEPDPDGDDVLHHALVWRSDEGLIWERVAAQESFAGSIMVDVVPTPGGVKAIGCKADLHCELGRIWTSSDGLTWELTAELPMAPNAAAANGTTIVAGGVDDTIDFGNSQAVLASSVDAAAWTVGEPLSPPDSGVSDLAVQADTFVATGSRWLRETNAVRGALHTSSDGQSWASISGGKFDGLQASAVASSQDLTIVAGMRSKSVTSAVPSIIWSRDLEVFRNGKFATKPGKDGVNMNGATIDVDAGLAFVVGTDGDRPAIWVSEIR